jgi:heat shock protein HspQ
MTIIQAYFSIGSTVVHRLLDYRGVVVDVDPMFLGSDEWVEDSSIIAPQEDGPWYYVLVDGVETESYVAQSDLVIDESGEPVLNPMVDDYFTEFDNGVYRTRDFFN